MERHLFFTLDRYSFSVPLSVVEDLYRSYMNIIYPNETFEVIPDIDLLDYVNNIITWEQIQPHAKLINSVIPNLRGFWRESYKEIVTNEI